MITFIISRCFDCFYNQSITRLSDKRFEKNAFCNLWVPEWCFVWRQSRIQRNSIYNDDKKKTKRPKCLTLLLGDWRLKGLVHPKNEYFIHDLLNPRADGKFGDVLSIISGASRQNSLALFHVINIIYTLFVVRIFTVSYIVDCPMVN